MSVTRAVGILFLPVCLGCGGRSGLPAGPPKPPAPECAVDQDCRTDGDRCKPRTCDTMPWGQDAGAQVLVARCVDQAPIDCEDGNPCTLDACDPATALCTHGPATLDLDGDGHRAPRPGYAPGALDACGDDCNDSNPAAFPGNPETCDGADNDCNGIVDDGASFAPLGQEAVRLSGPLAPATPGGLAYSGQSFAATYTGTAEGFNVYVSTVGLDGTVQTPPGEQPVSQNNGDRSGGPILWVGDRYGLAWQDRRTSDYEIFFTLLDATGAKKHADTQLSFAPGFSVNPSMAWNGNEFLVVWQDDRRGLFDLYGQRLSVDSVLVGDNLPLTQTQNVNHESPSIAAGLKTVGVAWAVGDAVTHRVAFQPFSVDLTQPAAPRVLLTDGTTQPVAPHVVWNQDRYVIAWYDKMAFPTAIYAATVDEAGTVLTPARAVTNPGAFRSRYPFLRPLGDRLLLVYADDRDQHQGYEVYSRMVAPTLEPLTAELRVTYAPRDSVFPIAAFGPKGFLGILFRDDREDGQQNVYFTTLGCVAGSP